MRAALTLLAVAACHRAPMPVEAPAPARRDDGGVDVSLTTADGVRLAATSWAGPAGNEKCVIFVHQLGATRDEWAPFVDALRDRYELLAIDLRGHGGSTRGPRGKLAWRDFDAAAWAAADRDVDAAMAFLEDRGFITADCAVIGSSIGGSLAVRFAGRRIDTAAVVLLSPGLAYHDLAIADAAAAFRNPALIVHAQEPASIAAADALAVTWEANLQLLGVDGDAHGLAMLEANPGILDIVVSFLDGALLSSPE